MINYIIKQEKRQSKQRLILLLILIVSLSVIFYFAYKVIRKKLEYEPTGLAVVYSEQTRPLRRFLKMIKEPQIGKVVPEFVLKDSKGNLYDIKNRKQKPMLIVFEAYGCDVCVAMKPILKNISDKYQDKLEIISVMPKMDNTKLQEYLKEYKIPYSVLIDEKGYVTLAYRVKQVPMYFVLDQINTLKYYNIGYLEEDELLKAIEEVANPK